MQKPPERDATHRHRPVALPPTDCDFALISSEPNSTDVLGSWTGMAKDGEPPVQDVDDL